MAADTSPTPAKPGRIARNTAIFSILTGLSRIAGLVREVVASSYFGTGGPFSAFTIAFQVPNLVRSLFADAALSAASAKRLRTRFGTWKASVNAENAPLVPK